MTDSADNAVQGRYKGWMVVGALHSADIVGWVCFIVGLSLIGVGTFVGLSTKPMQTSDAVKKKAAAAAKHLEVATKHASLAATSTGSDATDAATAASTETEKAKSLLADIGGIIGSLPEHLRFAGMLVLVGALLVSVATVQFGGTSLF